MNYFLSFIVTLTLVIVPLNHSCHNLLVKITHVITWLLLSYPHLSYSYLLFHTHSSHTHSSHTHTSHTHYSRDETGRKQEV